jgi:hypothetical protein
MQFSDMGMLGFSMASTSKIFSRLIFKLSEEYRSTILGLDNCGEVPVVVLARFDMISGLLSDRFLLVIVTDIEFSRGPPKIAHSSKSMERILVKQKENKSDINFKINSDFMGFRINAEVDDIINKSNDLEKYFNDIDGLYFMRNPIVKENTVYKRLKSFTINYSNTTFGKSLQNVNAIQNSVLANGTWHRFYVEKSGVYQVSKSFLQSIGVNVAVDPRNIKIYGNGGRMLPLLNSIPYPIDLEENAIQFIGEEDGVFNENDYILFYAEGVDSWNEESLTHVNQFADRSYYYVTTSGSSGKRIQPYTEPVASPTLFLSNYDGYQFHEVDLFNAGKIGRRWFGEKFDLDDNQTFPFVLPNYTLKEHFMGAPIILFIFFQKKYFFKQLNNINFI